MPTGWTALARIVALQLALSVVAAGASAQSVPPALRQAFEAYGSSDYRRAATLARAAGDRAEGVDRDSARYLEGIALFVSKDLDAAVSPLRSAAASSDRFVAGQAGVTLGSLEIERKRWDAAGHAYRRAAMNLDGDEARRAHSIAARCFDGAGLAGLAQSERVAAGESTPTAAPAPIKQEETAQPKVTVGSSDKPAPAQLPKTGSESASVPVRFAIQVGAFRSLDRAREIADGLRDRCTELGIDSPRITTREAQDGAALHVVQIGSFPNRNAAMKVLLKFPRSAYKIEACATDADQPG